MMPMLQWELNPATITGLALGVMLGVVRLIVIADQKRRAKQQKKAREEYIETRTKGGTRAMIDMDSIFCKNCSPEKETSGWKIEVGYPPSVCFCKECSSVLFDSSKREEATK